MIKKIFLILVLISLMMSFAPSAGVWAEEEEAAGDETATFTSTNSPDALIILDLSGSMAFNPAGGEYKYGSSSSCVPDTVNCVCTH